MKPSTFILPVLLTTVSFSGVDVKAEGQVFREQHCYENVENYIPGYYRSNGLYVKARISNRRRKVACDQLTHSAASYFPQHSYGHSEVAHGYHYPQQHNNYYPQQQQQQPIVINQPQNQCNGKLLRMGLGALGGGFAGRYAVGGKKSSNTILGTVLGAGAGTLIGRATC
jgi:hypothetical protein